MLSEFNNLPGIYVSKDDGNLRIIDSIPDDVTLIVGTAPDGPFGLYYVTDTGTAESAFDPSFTKEGTLLRGMYEAFENGASSVALYRIGSSPVALDFINGYTIVTNKASVSAGSKYKLFYTNDYNSSGIEVIRVYDAATGTIVYDSYAEIDTGVISVYGTQFQAKATKAITIGNDVATWSSSPTFAALMDFTSADYSITDAISADLVSSSKTFTTASSAFKAGQVIQIDAADNDDDGYFVVNYVTKTGSTYTVTLSKKVSYADGVVSEETWSGFSTTSTSDNVIIKAKYIEAKTGIGLNKNETFQELARAYWELESAKVSMVVPVGVHFNDPNVVDNEGNFLDDDANYAGNPSGDYLGKAYEFEHNGNIFFGFKNSFSDEDDVTADTLPTPYELGIDGFAAKAFLEGTHKFETAIVCADDTDISAAEDDIYWMEANFGHQLAMYLHGLSVNDNEAMGTIGMVPPSNFSKAGVSQWLGKAPQKNTSGNITVSGSGLLGYKFRSGSVGVSQGLFATSSGYVDGTAVLDRNQQAIDIGRYIDIVGTPVLLRSVYDGTSTGYLTPGAGVYAGTLMSYPANKSTTNKSLKTKVSLPFGLSKKSQDSLVAAGYVVFGANPNGGVRVVYGSTGALPTSDYTNRMTARIVSAIVEEVRRIGYPYIGSVTSPQIMISLEEEINSALKEFQNPQNPYILGGKAKVAQSRDMAIKGEAAVQLILFVTGELKRITLYVTLSK